LIAFIFNEIVFSLSLEEAGVLQGYHAEINLAKVGLPIITFMRMGIPPMQMSVPPGQTLARISALLCEMPEVLECYLLAGNEAFLMKVWVSSVEHLAELILLGASFHD